MKYKFFKANKDAKEFINKLKNLAVDDISKTPVIRLFDSNGNQLNQSLSFSEGIPKLLNSYSTAIKYMRLFPGTRIGVQNEY